MRKILFLVLVASVVGWGANEKKTSDEQSHSASSSKKKESGGERPVGDGLLESVKTVMEALNASEGPELAAAAEEQIKGLSDPEKYQLLAEIDSQLKNGGTDFYKDKRLNAVKKLIESESEEKQTTAETKPASPASAKPAATEMQKTKDRAFPNGHPSPIHELPGGRYAYAYLDKAGKPVLTADRQPVWAVGKKDSPTLDGLYPLSGLVLNYENGKLSIDPKASMHTVSTSNGPQVNSAVPVIFTSEGKAIARQGIIQNGKQNLYWTEGGKKFSSGITDGEVTAVGDEELPGVLTVAKNSLGTAYVTVSAPAKEIPVTSYLRQVSLPSLLVPFDRATVDDSRNATLAPVAQTPSTLSPGDLRKAFDQRMEMLVTSLPAPKATLPQTAPVPDFSETAQSRLVTAAGRPQNCSGPSCPYNPPGASRTVCTLDRSGKTTCQQVAH
jgi:hypothetical protein